MRGPVVEPDGHEFDPTLATALGDTLLGGLVKLQRPDHVVLVTFPRMGLLVFGLLGAPSDDLISTESLELDSIRASGCCSIDELQG